MIKNETTIKSSSPHQNSAASNRVARVSPHGGVLVNRLAQGKEAEDLLARAAHLPRISLDTHTQADAELIATGALSPLEGFVSKADYLSVIQDMRLRSGALFSIPITLPISPSQREGLGGLREGGEAALANSDGEVVGTIAVDEIFELERTLEAKEVYRTTDAEHPGVAYLYKNKGLSVAGRITLGKRTIERKFPEHHRDPSEVREFIAQQGWVRTVAFQTRNPIHRAHEYLLRCALEIADGLAVHPLVGETKGDDVPAGVRMACYEALLGKYFPSSRVLLTVFPFAMRYAGPREAVIHAISRQNYGFSHFIIGRDHAGVGNYYGTYDAQRIFDSIGPTDLEIVPLFFEHSFFCRACEGVASLKSCPHDPGERLTLSGTRVRELLTKGEGLPPEYSRPEVASILTAAYRERDKETQRVA